MGEREIEKISKEKRMRKRILWERREGEREEGERENTYIEQLFLLSVCQRLRRELDKKFVKGKVFINKLGRRDKRVL